MAATRTYGDGCAIAHGLDLVGERWSLLVVRELLLGPKRFTDLRRGLPNASPNVISGRLRELEAAGVVTREKLPPPAGSRVYALTDWGRELEAVVIALGRWGARSPAPPSGAPIGADSLALALRDRLTPGRRRAEYELRLGDDRYRLRLAGGAVELERGSAETPDATISADPTALAAVLWGDRSLADAERAGDVTVTGDRGAVEALVRATPAVVGPPGR